MECRDKVLEIFSIHNQYLSEKDKAEEDLAKKDKDYKAPKKAREVPEPDIESNYLKFTINFTIMKTLLFKFGYEKYWSKWSLFDLSDSALMLLVKGFTI